MQDIEMVVRPTYREEAVMSGDFVTVAQAAKRLDVTTRTIVRWIENGRFPGAFKIDPGIDNSPFLIPMDSFLAYESERKSEGTDNGGAR